MTAETATAVTKAPGQQDTMGRHGQRELLMPFPFFRRIDSNGRITGSPSSLPAGDLRIGEKHAGRGDTGCGKGSELLESLCHKHDGQSNGLSLLVRERYGKIYLTDTGFLLAKELFRCVEVIRERLPAMGFELTEEEATALAYTMVVNLPENSRKRLAGRE